eukprot:4693912-Pyramimonas_sp.AAC.1
MVREGLQGFAKQRLINSVVLIEVDSKSEAFSSKNGGLQGSCEAPRQFVGVFDKCYDETTELDGTPFTYQESLETQLWTIR